MKQKFYYSYYIFGHIKDKPIWEWDVWQKCMNILDPIVNLSPELPHISSSQSIPVPLEHRTNTISYNKEVSDLER